MSAAPDPYELLAALGQRELELAGGGRWEELRRLQATRGALMESLPSGPPARSGEALVRCAALQQQTAAVIAAQLRAARERVGTLDRGRAAIGRYAPASAPHTRVDAAG